MNKEEILKMIDSLNLDINDYYVLSGGSLLIQGLRETTNDLDLVVNERALEKLKQSYNLIKKYENGYIINHNIDVFLETNEDILNNRVIIDDYSCQSLESVYKFKKKLNREKDQDDLKKLESILNM